MNKRLKWKICHSYFKFFNIPCLKALVIADQLSKDLLLGRCLWSALFYHYLVPLTWFRIYLMLIYKSDWKGLCAWQSQHGYIYASLHALSNMGYSEMILSQVESSPSMFEYAVVTASQEAQVLGDNLGNCRIGKQRTLLLKDLNSTNTRTQQNWNRLEQRLTGWTCIWYIICTQSK